MNKMLRIVPLITLTLVLTTALVMSGCNATSNQDGLALGEITGCTTDVTQSPQVGNPAPNFQFQDPDGYASSLTALQGRPVLLNFWATWCGPCRSEMPYIQAIHEEWPEAELVLLAINLGESSSTVEDFMQSNNLSFTVLLDTTQVVAQEYSITGIPTTFFIDKDGIIQDKVIGAFQNKTQIENRLSKIIP